MATRTITTAASELIPRNRLRKSFVMQNEDAAINIYIKQERAETPTVSTTDHDHRLSPGSTISLANLTDGKEAIQDRWTIIAESGTPRISFLETEDQVR